MAKKALMGKMGDLPVGEEGAALTNPGIALKGEMAAALAGAMSTGLRLDAADRHHSTGAGCLLSSLSMPSCFSPLHLGRMVDTNGLLPLSSSLPPQPSPATTATSVAQWSQSQLLNLLPNLKGASPSSTPSTVATHRDSGSSIHSFNAPGGLDGLGNGGVEVDEVAQALNQLSIQQREKVFHDIHGTGRPDAAEDPLLVKTCLKALEERILEVYLHENAQPPVSRSALTLAMQQNPAYVLHEEFRLAFLRADDWDVSQAAHRMIRFFEEKRNLFGVEKLAEEITIDDFGGEDKECLDSGCMQHCPLKDRSGRSIFSSVMTCMAKYKTGEAVVRLSCGCKRNIGCVSRLHLTSLPARIFVLASLPHRLGQCITC